MPNSTRSRLLSPRLFTMLVFVFALLCQLSALPVKSVEASPDDSITGKLLMPDGTPIAQTTVTMYGRDAKAAPLATAVTDAQGVFSFPDGDALYQKCHNPALLADVPGMAFASMRLWPGIDQIELRPSLPSELHLTFVDTTGKPIPNTEVLVTRVQFHDLGSIEIPSAMQPRFTQQTDMNGSCTISMLPQGATVYLDLPKSPYAKMADNEIISLCKGPVTPTQTITLLPASSVSGDVVCSTNGKPAAGVMVYATSRAAHCYARGETDGNGHFQLTRLRPGMYDITLYLGKLNASWVAPPPQGVELAKGADMPDLRLQIVPGATITGKVRAVGTNEPVEKVMLQFHQTGGQWSESTVSDADGRYCIHTPPGEVVMTFSDNFLQPKGVSRPAVTTYTFQLKDGQTVSQDIEVTYKHTKPIHGRIVGRDEQPIAGATVCFVQINDDDRLEKTKTTTDANGEFTFNEGAQVILLAYKGTMGVPQEVPLPEGGGVTLHLEPNMMASVTGTVSTNSGDPIPNIHLHLYQTVTKRHGYSAPVAISDAQGKFSVSEVLPNKPYWIQADNNPGYGNGYVSGKPLQPGENGTADEMVLQKLDSSIAGTVVDEKGTPLSGIYLDIQGRETPSQQTVSDKDGKFHFDAVEGDNLFLMAIGGRNHQEPLQLTAAGQSDVKFVVKTDSK